MNKLNESRRQFLKTASLTAGTALLSSPSSFGQPGWLEPSTEVQSGSAESGSADYTLRIKTTPVELAPDRIVSLITYNGQFPGPLLRFKEGQPVTVDVFNETDTPEQLHWHGQTDPLCR